MVYNVSLPFGCFWIDFYFSCEAALLPLLHLMLLLWNDASIQALTNPCA